MLKSQELREQRAKLINDAKAITDKKDVTVDELRSANKMLDDASSLLEQVTVIERAEEESRKLVVATGTPKIGEPGRGAEDIEGRVKAYGSAFEAYVRGGLDELTPEQRSALRQGASPELRAQSVGTNTAGGFLVPQGFMAELERGMKWFGGMRQAARVITTDSGNVLPWPTVNDTSNTGALIAENTTVSTLDVAFSSVSLNAYKFTSGIVLVSSELLQDAAFNIDSEVGSLLGERLGRVQNTFQTTGTGSSQPQGVTVGATLGYTFASSTAITADELFTIYHSVDKAYRSSPKCAFMMNDLIFKAVRLLKDSQGRYLWEPSIKAGEPDTLLGKSVIINNDMASTIATGNKTIVFGDFSKYIIRDVRGIYVKRLNERYADSDQTAFLAFYRGDGKVVSAASNALIFAKQL